jgi:hypothetical protein
MIDMSVEKMPEPMVPLILHSFEDPTQAPNDLGKHSSLFCMFVTWTEFNAGRVALSGELKKVATNLFRKRVAVNTEPDATINNTG